MGVAIIMAQVELVSTIHKTWSGMMPVLDTKKFLERALVMVRYLAIVVKLMVLTLVSSLSPTGMVEITTTSKSGLVLCLCIFIKL